MRRAIERVLRRFPDANLSSETARKVITDTIRAQFPYYSVFSYDDDGDVYFDKEKAYRFIDHMDDHIAEEQLNREDRRYKESQEAYERQKFMLEQDPEC